MTNYTTSVGVQQFSITIASGSTTGTATIAAVGSGAFITYGGLNPSVSANVAEDLAYLTLTNSTTITATRNTGTAGTVVINGSITDGDTTNLIKSVQFGTVTITASTSGTASISAVTNANTAAHYLGHKSTDTGLSLIIDFTRLSLSGTTVTATVPNSATNTTGFCIIEFQSTALTAQAVQNVSATSSGNTASWTATITAVTLANALTIAGGRTMNGTTNLAQQFHKGVLTNTTTFTASSNTSVASTRVSNASIIDFNSGVLNSAIQRATANMTGSSGNVAITTVTLVYAGLSWLNNTTAATTAVLDQGLALGLLLDASTVQFTRVTATSSIIGSFEVFEFPAFVPDNSIAGINQYYSRFIGRIDGMGGSV